MTTRPDQRPPRTLGQFAKDQKRATCAICKLPAEAREQLRGAADKRINRETQASWVETEFNVKVTVEVLDRHRTERHDQP